MIEKVKRNVNKKDQMRLGLVEKSGYGKNKNATGDNSKIKAVYASALEKINRKGVGKGKSDSERNRERALRVWSKTSRSGKRTGVSSQIVNKGVIQRDRGLCIRMDEEKPKNGVYTRFGRKDEKARGDRFNHVYQSGVSTDMLQRKGVGRKVVEPNKKEKRMWLSSSLRNSAKIKEVMSVLVEFTKNSNWKSEKVSDDVKTHFIGKRRGGFVAQRISVPIRIVSMEKIEKSTKSVEV